jgi:hypothetical protein
MDRKEELELAIGYLIDERTLAYENLYSIEVRLQRLQNELGELAVSSTSETVDNES